MCNAMGISPVSPCKTQRCSALIFQDCLALPAPACFVPPQFCNIVRMIFWSVSEWLHGDEINPDEFSRKVRGRPSIWFKWTPHRNGEAQVATSAIVSLSDGGKQSGHKKPSMHHWWIQCTPKFLWGAKSGGSFDITVHHILLSAYSWSFGLWTLKQRFFLQHFIVMFVQ